VSTWRIAKDFAGLGWTLASGAKDRTPLSFAKKTSLTKRGSLMTFQAYIDNIKAKTGKTPEDFKKLAEKQGLLQPGIKAGAIVAWLKRDFGLGHGHAMAIYATFKGRTK
jgi:hypothetical protein